MTFDVKHLSMPRPSLVGRHLILTDVEERMIVLQRESDCEYYERKIDEIVAIIKKYQPGS